MPSMRELVSGRDFQLRYALHRLTLLALGADPLHDRAVRMRLEWPLAVDDGEVWADAVLEDGEGRILEVIECKEHRNHIASKSVRTFFRDIKRLDPLLPEARFRFVTNARHLPNGASPWMLTPPPIAPDRIAWEVDAPNKDSLAMECIAHFARTDRDPYSLYARLYSRLAAQMAARLQRDGKIFERVIHDIHAWLFSEIDSEALGAALLLDGEASFAVAELRGVLQKPAPRRRAHDSSRERVALAIGTGLFSDSTVTLKQIFVEPAALANVHRTAADSTHFSGSALSLLFQWLATRRTNGAGRLSGLHGADVPLLVLGAFGSGKTSLLVTFAERLLDRDPSIVPIFVRLRELKAAGTSIPLMTVLRKHIRDTHGIDIDEYEDEICLLCDGFDELNLFYTQGDQYQWVEEGYRHLSFVAQRKNITVILSSRPILFIASAAALRDGATRMHLQEFDDDRIRQWCERYRRSAGLSEELSFEFLEQRDLVAVARTPIVLYMIARIFETQRELLEPKRYTRAEIYRLFITWTERGRYHTDDEKHALPENYREILQEIAWLLFQSGKGAVAESELLEGLRAVFGATVDRIPIDRNILVAHMLRTTADERDGSDLIEFTHQSFREYLVAERIWRLLAPVRAGASLDAETWIGLAGRLLTEAKVELLTDMVGALSAAEAEALYRGLEGADNIHKYWAEWSRPVWDRMTSDRLRAWFATLPSRAAGMAVLAFVLRVAAYRRWATVSSAEPELEAPRTDTLQRLLSFLQTFPESGVAGEAQSLLLQNLRGLRLAEVSSLPGIDWSGADLSDCRLADINFEGSTFGGIIAVSALFTRCAFNRTLFQVTAPGTTFDSCDFTSARLMLNAADDTLDVRFTGCRFESAVFEELELRAVTFTDCIFDGARVLRGTPAVLTDCTLDATARAFFRKQGVRFVRT